MTPQITTRSFSNDNYFVDNVFFNNYYKFKGEKNSKRVVVDIGAHIGCFTFTALLLGCAKVYAFEPFIDNFALLLQNTYNNHFVGRITPYQVGIDYKEDKLGLFATPEWVNDIYFDFGAVGIISDKSKNHYPCYLINLDTLLEFYCYNETIDVLKINIGYFEQEVLLRSELLSKNVNSICGEAELDDTALLDFKKQLGIKGFMNFYSKPPNAMGRTLFWASKPPLKDNFNIEI